MMIKTSFALLATLAAMASAVRAEDRPLSRTEAIAACVELKEKAVSCKDDWADYWASLAPADKRARIREKVLPEIVTEGSGPLAPRQEKCGLDVDRKKSWAMLTGELVAAARACYQANGCKERVACSVEVMKKAKEGSSR
jgi:hypothetical protein